MWQNEELATLALFDNTATKECKRRICEAISHNEDIKIIEEKRYVTQEIELELYLIKI